MMMKCAGHAKLLFSSVDVYDNNVKIQTIDFGQEDCIFHRNSTYQASKGFYFNYTFTNNCILIHIKMKSEQKSRQRKKPLSIDHKSDSIEAAKDNGKSKKQ